MGETFVPATLSQINNQASSAVTTINTNFQTIATLFEDVVSLSGQSPNAMQASLDMNGFAINNVPGATQTGQPVTYEQLTSFANGTTFPAVSMVGVISAANFPALTGDLTGTAGSLAVTVSKINGVTISGTTGAGNNVLSTGPTLTNPTITGGSFSSPTLTTPTLGVANATSVVIAAGTTSTAPLYLTAGTSLTTPTAGVEEYDGIAFYKTPIASNRGVIRAEHFQRLTSNYTLANSTAAQAAFNATTNGAITLAATTAYAFEVQIVISNTGVTSHTWGILFGGTATLTSGSMVVQATTGTSTGITAVSQGFTNTLGTTFVATAASTSATETAIIKATGIVSINAGGTFIPQLQLSAATGTAASVLAGSFIKLNALGTNTVTNVGNWS